VKLIDKNYNSDIITSAAMHDHCTRMSSVYSEWVVPGFLSIHGGRVTNALACYVRGELFAPQFRRNFGDNFFSNLWSLQYRWTWNGLLWGIAEICNVSGHKNRRSPEVAFRIAIEMQWLQSLLSLFNIINGILIVTKQTERQFTVNETMMIVVVR